MVLSGLHADTADEAAVASLSSHNPLLVTFMQAELAEITPVPQTKKGAEHPMLDDNVTSCQ